MSNKIYDLEDRTLKFTKRIIGMCKVLPGNAINYELIKQIMRSGPSVGANYREANEALGKKDFLYRMRISRKECKETLYWFEAIIEANPLFKERIIPLYNEGVELKKILSKIIYKSENKKRSNK